MASIYSRREAFRNALAAFAVGISVTSAGCVGALTDDDDEADAQEVVDDQSAAVDLYAEGYQDFENGMEDFERGEELFEEGDYQEAERYFRDAERSFGSASGTIRDAESDLRQLSDTPLQVGDAVDLMSEAAEIAIGFEVTAEFHKEGAREAQDDPRMGEIQIEASQQTIEEDIGTREIPDDLSITAAIEVEE